MEINYPQIAIFMQHGSHENFHLMASLAGTAVSQNGEVLIFLKNEALKIFVEDGMDKAPSNFCTQEMQTFYHKALKTNKIASPLKLITGARQLGKIKIFACSESTKLFRFSVEQTKNLDEVIGYTTFVNLARNFQWVVI